MTRVSIIPDRYTRATFQPSQYPGLKALPSPEAIIEICADGLVLDLPGVVLDGEGNGGVAVWVHDCSDVTIANGIVIGFHWGIRAENVNNHTAKHLSLIHI